MPARVPRRQLAATVLILIAATLTGWSALGVLRHLDPTVDPPDSSPAAIETHLRDLADDSYTRREAATAALIAAGPAVEDRLRAEFQATRDPEVFRRLEYVLANLHPPTAGVLVASAAAESGLLPGDIITHANARPIAETSELVDILRGQHGAVLRIRRGAGTLEVGPVRHEQLGGTQRFSPPRGLDLAEILRMYHDGKAVAAADRLLMLDSQEPLTNEELAGPLRATIAFTGGRASQALEWMAGHESFVRHIGMDPWSSPSQLDWLIGRKAPLQLEWELFTRGGAALQSVDADADLRMQRVLVPAGRYVDTLVRAAQLWSQRQERGSPPTLAGNMLAIVGWMMHELDLRSECCRLIEPRSVLLRRGGFGPQKWIRVDTEAWLPFFAGREAEALTLFFDHAYGVLGSPPAGGPGEAVIRNPEVAARVAFFAYRHGEARRIEELVEVVAREGNPALRPFAFWMLYALTDANADSVHRDLITLLPRIADADAFDVGRWAATLEYLHPRPDPEVFSAARRMIFDAAPPAQRDLWLAIIDAMKALRANDPTVAMSLLAPFTEHAEAASLTTVAAFRHQPPSGAARHAALADPLLASRFGSNQDAWLLLSASGRLLMYDAAADTLTAPPPPTAGWRPNPLCWPILSGDPDSGRAWVYALRRVVEYDRSGHGPVRLNIRPDQIADFDRLVRSFFNVLAEALANRDLLPGEQGDFLSSDVRANDDLAVDPYLPEIGVIQETPGAPHLRYVALRGGPFLLVDVESDRAWSDGALARRLGIDEPLPFFARGSGAGPDSPIWLFTQRGLLRFTPDGDLQPVPLPDGDPFPTVIPERVPYDRNEPGAVYVARMPADGGAVYRIDVGNLSASPVDLVNLALPPEYYAVQSRAAIRAEIDQRLQRLGIPGLEGLISDAIRATQAHDQNFEDDK